MIDDVNDILKRSITSVVAFLLGVCVITIINWLKPGLCKSKARLDGKTVIVTGCTSGIGRYTAFDIANRGARVILACRNLQKANKVRDEILPTDSIAAATKNTNIVVKLLDVSLLESVREFADDINRTEQRLDVLIHNAGVLVSSEKNTKEGLNVIWATNYFGPFLLTHLLLDLLKRTGNSRIVMVSSAGHKMSRLNMSMKSEWNGKSDIINYFDSKLAEILFINQLTLRLIGTDVTANSLHPGAVGTAMLMSEDSIWNKVLNLLFHFVTKNVEEGSQTTVYLAVSDEVNGVTGKYFSDCKESTPSSKTKDLALATYLWSMSEEVVKLNTSKKLE